MKRLNSQEFTKTNEYIKNNLLAELIKISVFRQEDDKILCDVILNGELYELRIYCNIKEIMLDEIKKTFDLKKVLFSFDTQKMILIPKSFSGFEKDFSEVIKIEYEKDTGYSLHKVKKDHRILTIEEYMVIDYSLYGSQKPNKLYGYCTMHERLDDGRRLQNEYAKTNHRLKTMFDMTYVKNFGCEKNTSNYIAETFRTKEGTSYRRMSKTIENDREVHTSCKWDESDDLSIIEILIKNYKQKSKQLVKE